MNDKQLTTPVVRGANLSAGGSVRPIVPDSFEGAYRMAQVVVAAGMAPKSIDTVEKACVAIMHGMEVGLTPMAALQSIAVVNGMPTIWGDGMLGLVRASGLLESIDEDVQLDNDGEPTIATCRVRRKGDPNETVGSFTRPEATRAGLWNKAGPWTQYRPRMMKMRARSWALRDKFPDVLRGLGMAEEAADTPVDITSRTTFAPPEPRRSDAAPVEAKPNVNTAGSVAGDAPQERAPVEPEESWVLPHGLLGQDAVIAALGALLAKTKTESDVAEILMENAAAIGRITGQKKLQWDADVNERRRVIQGEQELP